MKKLTLLTITTLTIASFGGQALTALAAGGSTDSQMNGSFLTPTGNRVIIAYGSCNNLQDALDKLENCIPGITLPDCVFPEAGLPDTDIPEIDIPETDAPESNIPETEFPETDTPDTNIPDTNTPGDENMPNDAPTVDTEQDNTQNNEHAFIKQIVDLVNKERAKEGLVPLTINLNVQAAAQIRAKECEQSFSHTRPNGSSFATALKEQNVSYRNAGENIAWGQRSPQAVMDAWMNSSGHRANIMNPNFTTIGVGYYQNTNGTNYWCQLFTR